MPEQLGSIGNGLPVRRTGNTLYPNIQLINTEIDNAWAASYKTSGNHNAYYDYLFTGQDIIVCVDGTEDDPHFRSLPLIQLGFRVSQQKTPVYGFWDYTYRAVMRGTRIIEGSMTLATKSPHYMRDLLSKAAESRQERMGSANYNYNRGLTEDDSNISQYWGKNIDPSLNAIGASLYSVHPPFSFVIIYGVQNVSVASSGTASALYQRYAFDNPWMTDINERLVEADFVNQSDRIILDACEIQSMETAYGPDGSVVSETYSFFGRDIITPS